MERSGGVTGLAIVSIGGKAFAKAGAVVFVGGVGAGAVVANTLTRKRFLPRFNQWAHYVTPTEEFAPDYGKKR